jgi:3-methyladenine DNA glycosylase Tag
MSSFEGINSFKEIEERAYARHGGCQQVEAKLIEPLPVDEIAEISDDRWLSAFSKIVFQTGFNWSVIEKKWPAFEETFGNFNLRYCASLSDEAHEEKMKEGNIVKHWAKVSSIRTNAIFLLDLLEEHSSLGEYFAGWKAEDYCDNVQLLKARGSRLGGRVGQIAMRRMGVDSLILSSDVLGALGQAGSISKMPTSKKAWTTLQQTIDQWREETDYSLNKISQLLGFSYGDIYEA